jgi:hypothetical protein
MVNANSKSCRRVKVQRILLGTAVVLVVLYLVLVFVFGRPFSIFGAHEDSEKESHTGATTGDHYAGWEQFELINLIGTPADEVRNVLGNPGVDNTLASTSDGGLKFASASTGKDSSKNLAKEVVVGYCVSMELADRIFLSVGTADNVSPGELKTIRGDRHGVLASYMKSKKCGPGFNGGIHVNTVLVRPH